MGSYILAEFFSYFGLYRVTAVDENTILLQVGPFSETFRQTEPYVFHIISSNTIVAVYTRTLHFRMEDGRVTHVMLGNGFDLTPLPQGRSMPILIGSAAIVIIGALFFLSMPIVILISFLRKKEKITRFNLFSNGMLLCGTLLVLNHVILFVRTLAINLFRSPGEIAPHIWVNYGLLFLTVGLLIASVLTIIKSAETRPRRKVFFGLTILAHTLMYAVLWNWNFFMFL